MPAGKQPRTNRQPGRTVVRRRTVVAVAAIAALLAGVTPAAAASAAPYRKPRPHAQVYKSVPGVVVKPHPTAASRPGAATRPPVAPHWPGRSTGTATTSPGTTTPVPGTSFTVDAGSGPGATVTVDTQDQQTSARLGLTGVVFSVTGADRPGLTVGIDYAPWAAGAGGDWAGRLQLLELPACALTTPQVTGCATGRTVPARNDRAAHRLQLAVTGTTSPTAATTPTAAAATTTTRTFAVTATPNGGTGSYAATPLSASSAWQAGDQTGEFTWSYPITVPPGVGGPTPNLAIDYSSGSVDGRTESTNNQTSWVGEGHTLEPGYVERKYVPCADDMTGGNNATRKTGDLCWRSDNATVVLGGHTNELVKDTATGTWKLRNDDGSKVERLNTGSNADNDHETWVLTSQDGTRYYFGRGLRGAADTAGNSNATWTVPVAGNQPGEPCYASGFGASFCTQAWRWNLDYVVDVHGNSMSYYYTPETNNYGRNQGSAKVGYVRGGYLSRIEYGERTGTEQSTAAPAQVLFDTAERCIPTATLDCAPTSLTATTAPSWPDVPFDLICADGANACTGQFSPSFFSRRRLTGITTQTWNGTGYTDVDNWTLGQSFPDPGDGTAASLWLASITHTGKVGGTAAMPSVTFDGIQLQNRVDGGLDGAYPLIKWRVNTVRLETGGVLSVAYSAPDCVYGTAMPTAEDTNDKRCFPAYYTPPGATAPVLHYFHKYLVTSLTEDGMTGGDPARTTTYQYLGAPAWHYDDNQLAQPKYRTWSDWRGYAGVRTVTGTTTGAQTAQQDLYLRGMDGDLLKNGTRRSVSVTDSQGGTIIDTDRLRGYQREHQVLDGPAGTEIQGTRNTPWLGPVTANDGVHTAQMLNTATVDGRRTLTGGAVQRSQVTTAYDTYGLPTSTDDAGDTALTTDDLCTRTEYARNPALNLVTPVSRTETVAVRCAATAARPGDVVNDTRTYFDGSTALGAAPTLGDPTRNEQIATWTTAAVYAQTGRASYDPNGRVLASWDALDRKTSTAYTPATGGPVTTVATTNPLGQVDTTTLDPARGAATARVDANNHKTEMAYDPLGRVTNVWLANRPRATTTPSLTFGYLVRKNGPVVVTTDTLANGGAYRRTTALFDGLLRPVQTQTQALPAAGQTTPGRLLSDTHYDARGLVVTENGPYYNASPPGTDLLGVADNAVPTQTKTSYDGAGRPTRAQFRSYGLDKWATTTGYGGDRVTVTPPAGGVATTTVTDLRGRTSELRQYQNGTAGAYDTTRYAYTPADQLAALTDPAGNTWRYGYDLRHRQTSADDPDTGHSTRTYDDAGQLLTSTDARNRTLATNYDLLGRRTELRDTTATGTLRAAWTYDTVAKGQPATATRYDNGNAYTRAVTAYDALDRPTASTVTIPVAEGALAGTYSTATTFNEDGTVFRTDLPTTGDIQNEGLLYSYDELGEPKSLHGRAPIVQDTTYTAYGEVSQLVSGTKALMSITQTFSHDEATHQLIRATLDRESIHPTDADLHYSYDPAGNLTKIADTPAGGTTDTQCFAYDYLRRLTNAWTGTDDCAAAPTQALIGGPAPYWQSYTYDPTGNRTTRTDHASAGNTVATSAYPAAGQPRPHTVTGISTTGPAGPRTDTFGYDAAGNTTGRAIAGQGAQTLAYDSEGHLASVIDPTGTTGYLYDADGTRLIRREPTGTTLYLDGTELRLDKTAGATPKATRYYTYNGVTIALKKTGQGTTTLFDDPHGTAEFAVANDTAAITRRRSGPFGDDRGTPPTAWPSTQGFLGGTQDPTGLTHLGAREYDPARGRFISRDPIIDPGDPQQINGYSYSANNPTTFSDPTGLKHNDEGGSGAYTQGQAAGQAANPAPPTRSPNAADHDDYNRSSTSRQAQDHNDTRFAAVRAARQVYTRDTHDANLDLLAAAASSVLQFEHSVHVFVHGPCADWTGPSVCPNTAIGVVPFAPGSAGALEAGRLGTRAEELHGALDEFAQTRRTSAVMSTREGPDILASGGRDLSTAQRGLARPGDILARMPGAHAEVSALDAAAAHGLTPAQMAVSRFICPMCRDAIEESGGIIGETGRTALWP